MPFQDPNSTAEYGVRSRLDSVDDSGSAVLVVGRDHVFLKPLRLLIVV